MDTQTAVKASSNKHSSFFLQFSGLHKSSINYRSTKYESQSDVLSIKCLFLTWWIMYPFLSFWKTLRFLWIGFIILWCAKHEKKNEKECLQYDILHEWTFVNRRHLIWCWIFFDNKNISITNQSSWKVLMRLRARLYPKIMENYFICPKSRSYTITKYLKGKYSKNGFLYNFFWHDENCYIFTSETWTLWSMTMMTSEVMEW